MLRLGALGADHLTLEGGWGEGDFEKSFLQTLTGRKNLALRQTRKEMLQSYFIIPGGGGGEFPKSHQNYNHSG